MTEREGASVDVDDIGVDAEYACGVDRDACKGLVYLDEIEVIRVPSGFLERELPGVSGDGQQVGRLLGHLGVRHDGAERLEATFLGEALSREHDGAGAVSNARGVTGGHSTPLPLWGLRSPL